MERRTSRVGEADSARSGAHARTPLLAPLAPRRDAACRSHSRAVRGSSRIGSATAFAFSRSRRARRSQVQLLQQPRAPTVRRAVPATMARLRTTLTALAGYGEMLADQVMAISDAQWRSWSGAVGTMHLSARSGVLGHELEEVARRCDPSESLRDLVRSALAVWSPWTSRADELDLASARARCAVERIDKAASDGQMLGNASKFTTRQGAVRLSKDSTSVGRSKDTGSAFRGGAPRLFRPFAQVDTGPRDAMGARGSA